MPMNWANLQMQSGYQAEIDVLTIKPLQKLRGSSLKRRIFLPSKKVFPESGVDEFLPLCLVSGFGTGASAAVPARFINEDVICFGTKESPGSNNQSSA